MTLNDLGPGEPQELASGSTGGIETHGIGRIPEKDQYSKPSDISWILIGAELTFGPIVLGWLPIAFGLGWWAAFTAITVGTLIGAIAGMPIALLGPSTGTNGAVSSGAYFGVVGRIVGSVLALFIALGFVALSVWTGGQAAVAGAHRLFETPQNDLMLSISYLIITAVSIVAAVYGHAVLLKVEKWMIPTAGLVLVAGFFAFGSRFDAGYGGGEYLLGSFWPTWFLSVTVGASSCLMYTPFVNDYARYVSPKRHSRRSILAATWAGLFVGSWFALTFAAYVASTFGDVSIGFVDGLVSTAPTWYLLPIILVGIVGCLGQSTLCIYGTGLDFSSIIPRLPRVAATLIIAAVSVALIFLGTLVWDAVDSVGAFIAIAAVATTPWLAINLIGHFIRGAQYWPDDLQVFNRRERGGRYWFSGGVNYRAMVAWVVGTTIGLLFLHSTFYVGPFSNSSGGVDLSWVSSGIVGSLIYLASLRLFPEAAEVGALRTDGGAGEQVEFATEGL